MDLTNKIIAFGDSVMKGVIYDGREHHVTTNSFLALCAQKMCVNICNYSKMGFTILDGIQMFHKRKSTISEGDCVLTEFGGNDCDFNWQEISEKPDGLHLPNVSLQGFVYSYIILLEDIKKLGAKPIIFSLPPLASKNYFNYFSRMMDSIGKENIMKWLHSNVEFISQWHEQYNLAIFKIAHETNTKLIDISSCMLSKPYYTDFLCQDGIHPNENGHRIIAYEIEKSFNLRTGSS